MFQHFLLMLQKIETHIYLLLKCAWVSMVNSFMVAYGLDPALYADKGLAYCI